MTPSRIGVLGTGMVGRTLGAKLVALGHDVMLGSRAAGNARAVEWATAAGSRASEGSFGDAAAFGELVVNATAGARSLDALAATNAGDLAGKVLLDVANPLDHTAGTTTLTICNTDSLGERIQREHPNALVVKALNTMNADVMVDPGLVPGSHTVFTCGNERRAKDAVAELLRSFGWPPADIMDLGDITAARGTEMYLALWLRLWSAAGTGHLNIDVKRHAGRP